MIPSNRLNCSLLLMIRVLTVIALALITAHAAEDAKRSYNLPSGDAAVALRQFAETSGKEVLFAAETMRGVRTPALRGDFTPHEAMTALLAGTGLVATPDAKTGALAVRRATPPPIPKETARAEPSPTTRAENQPALAMDQVEVTGSRLRSILGEQGANPVITFDREFIEGSGITSLADLRNYIPQLSIGSAASFDGNSGGSSPEGRLIFNARGITGNNTLVLVDGRRLPRTGQRGVVEGYEATGIPLSAIERVEVLLDGGSAVYGADAVAGVVNIITRKNYRGVELETVYDNTFDKDAANLRWSLTASFQKGRFSARVFGSYEEQKDLARLDRYWLRSDDRRYIGGTDGRSVIPVGGRILNAANTNSNAPTMPLPGTNGALVLRIPANSDGRNVTIADYVGAGEPTDADRYDSAPYTNATNRFRRSALTTDLNYAWRPWLKANLNVGWRQNNSFGKSGPVSISTSTNTVNPAVSTTIPAGYPGNPFGVPITLQKFFWDLGVLDRRYGMETWNVYSGVSGALPREWRYEAGVNFTQSNPTTEDQVFQFDSTKLSAAIRSATPPVLLHDSRSRVGNPAGTIENLFLTGANGELPKTWTYDLKADGPVFALPGGNITAAAGTEMREEYIAFNREFFAAGTESAQPKEKRVVTAGFLETQVPIFTPQKNSVPLIHQFSLNAAVRGDSYNDFGGSTRLRFGAVYRPLKWFMLRATHGEAFKVPLLVDLTRPIGRQSQTFTPTGTFSLTDTLRNNEPVLGPVINQTGGSPNLRPEQSTNDNVGIVLESPFALFKGFSFSVSRNTIVIEDRVGGLNYQERLAFFPEMFVRGPSLGDGLPGKIIEVDNRSVNIASFKNEAWDYQVRYSRTTATWGSFDLLANATETTKLEVRARPGVAPSATQTALLRPTRGSANLNWNLRGLSVGVSAIYQEGFPQSTVTSTLMPSTILWNGQLGYDFDRGSLASRVPFAGRYLGGTRVSLGFVNIFNNEPWISATGATSSVIDPRLRRYSITLRKSFGAKPGVRLPGRR